MAITEKLNLLIRMLKPEHLKMEVFIEWWMMQPEEWQFQYCGHLMDSLMVCIEHHLDLNNDEDLYF